MSRHDTGGTVSRQKKTGLILIACAVLYFVGFISVLSHLRADIISQIGVSVWDKLAHFAAFLPIGFFLGAGLRRSPFCWSFKKSLVVGVVVIALFGAIDELHQSLVPSRDSSVWDVVADILGGWAGLVIGAGGLRGVYQKGGGVNRSRSRTT